VRESRARCRSSRALARRTLDLVELARIRPAWICGGGELAPTGASRELVRFRLSHGTLPPMTAVTAWSRPGTGARCAVCDHSVLAPDFEFEIADLPCTFAHSTCLDLWREESMGFRGSADRDNPANRAR